MRGKRLVLFCSLIVVTGLVLEVWKSVSASDLVLFLANSLDFPSVSLHTPINGQWQIDPVHYPVTWSWSRSRQVKVDWYELLCFGIPSVQLGF